MAGWDHKKLHNEKGGRHGICKTQERYNKSFFYSKLQNVMQKNLNSSMDD